MSGAEEMVDLDSGVSFDSVASLSRHPASVTFSATTDGMAVG